MFVEQYRITIKFYISSNKMYNISISLLLSTEKVTTFNYYCHN